MNFEIGDKIISKKTHPCGGNVWTVTRVGADIKIKCDGSYDSYVSAMNAAIFHLSGQIAVGISEFASKNKK